MVLGMKKIALLLFFLILPSALADIAVIPQQHAYNLGNKLKASASVLSDSFEGLFKISLVCDNYDIQYFVTPLSLESGYRTALYVPELQITPPMLGTCKVTATLSTNNGTAMEEKPSSTFLVTRDLSILPTDDYVSSLPGKLIKLVGVLNEAFGNNVLNATILARIDNFTSASLVDDGTYEIGILLPPDIKSGKHKIELIANDPKSNSGTAALDLNIIPVPSRLEVNVNETTVLPGSKFTITASLYDQAQDLINETLSLTSTSPSGKTAFSKNVASGEAISYDFSQNSEPGDYIITGEYKNMIGKSGISVASIRELQVRYEGQSVLLENIGNTPFIDDLTFYLKDGPKNIPLAKKFSIEPGKILNIDLSKEVPKGIYDIMIPVKEGISTLKNDMQYVFGSDGKESEIKVVADKVEIEDNRPLLKKISNGLSSMTGNVIGADGILTRNSWIAPTLLFGIIGLIIFRYGRKPIKALFRGREGQEQEIREQTPIKEETKYK